MHLNKQESKPYNWDKLNLRVQVQKYVQQLVTYL